jgi:hypothetical protein
MEKVLQDIQVVRVVTQGHNLIQDQVEVAVVPLLSWSTVMKLQPLEAVVEGPAQVKVQTVQQVLTQTQQQVIHQAH